MFGRKKQQLVPLAEKPVGIEVLQTVELQSHPHSHYLDLFDKYRDDFFAAIAPKKYENLKSYDKDDFNKALQYFELIRKIWLSIDRTRINQTIGMTMYDIAYRELPTLINNFHQEVISGEDISWGASMIQDPLAKLSTRLNALAGQAATWRVTHSSSNPETTPAPNIVAGFPIFETDDIELQSAFNQVQELWVRLKERNNIVDDEFFLEQTANSYIPDVLAIYKSFNNASSEEKKAARALLLEHFQTVEMKMIEIATHTMRSNLSALKTQVVFMKDKIVPSPDSELVLEKGN